MLSVNQIQRPIAEMLSGAKAHPEYAAHLVPKPGSEIVVKDWSLDSAYGGAFALDTVQGLSRTNAAYSQFQSVLPTDPQPNSGVTLANDFQTHGGWLDAAMNNGVNAASAALYASGGKLGPGNPLEQNTKLYNL